MLCWLQYNHYRSGRKFKKCPEVEYNRISSLHPLSWNLSFERMDPDGRSYQAPPLKAPTKHLSQFLGESQSWDENFTKFSSKLWQMFHKLGPRAPGDTIFPDFLTLSEKLHLSDCNNSSGTSIFIGSEAQLHLAGLWSGGIDKVTVTLFSRQTTHTRLYLNEVDRNPCYQLLQTNVV